MGYRSDVYIKITRDKLFEVSNLLEKLKTEYDVDLVEYELVKCTKKYIYIKLSEWKFYRSYPEVKVIIEFVESSKGSAGLIEIGEDGESVHLGDPYELGLCTTTEIAGFNYDEPT